MGYCLFPRLTFGADTRNQVRALCLCWLVVHSHVLGSPVLNGQQPPPQAERSAFATPSTDCGDKDCSSVAAIENVSKEPARLLQVADEATFVGGPPFFTTTPYANIVVVDSHDPNCDQNYTAPPIYTLGEPGYPADGTDALRKRNMACGIAPARFVFRTSDMDDYEDETVTAAMQVRIHCRLSRFIETDSCENVLDATGGNGEGFPAISACRFMSNEARFILSTRLLKNAEYSITVKLVNPQGRVTASENSFHLTTEYYQLRLIEGTLSPIDMIATIDNAKDTVLHGVDFTSRGYITGLTWQPDPDYSPMPGVETKFKFGLRSFGIMDNSYRIDVIAYPTNVWDLGIPGDDCRGWQFEGLVGVTCKYRSFYGQPPEKANGFRLEVGATDVENRGGGTTFDLRIMNPTVPVNMYWTATSFKRDSNELQTEVYTVWLDKPISVLGKPQGRIAAYELASVSVTQWVELAFRPDNTVMPSSTQSGFIVIMPPDTFTVVASSAPQAPGLEYNNLPCKTWPAEAREANPARWVCTLQDNAPFKDTEYRVRLRVVNPPTGGAASSWRVEIWQEGKTQPISISRSLLGIPLSGAMRAALAPANQGLSSDNILRFDFTPTQDVGLMEDTRLEVTAPAGFMIVKRCLGFTRIQLPACECRGADGNGFTLTFTDPDAIKADTTYIFELQVANPDMNVPDDENFWTFQTVRPDGVPRDSARYAGFFLFPAQIQNFEVVPVSRRAGPQFVVVRFISATRIPFDDYISIRAPYDDYAGTGVVWHAEDLGFQSTAPFTNATSLGTSSPEVVLETPNVLVVQLTQTAEAQFEYGFYARCVVPAATPVPNRWWIEQKRQTGLAPPNNWRYIASTGAEGFKTQVLVNARVEPFNIVEEGWQNPTLIVFEATEAVQARTIQTAAGPVLVPAELYIEAPRGFTYICPLSETHYMPEYTVEVPSNVECEVNHNVESERHKLRLFFPDGIEAGTRYGFTIDVVNGNLATMDLANNFFRLVTRVGGAEVEDVVLPGYNLARRMDNTRYIAGGFGEDKYPEFTNNMLTFLVGTTYEINYDTLLEIKAPVGFRFKLNCIPYGDVLDASASMGTMTLPTINLCQSQEHVDVDMANIVHLTMTGTWHLGESAITIAVENPRQTPRWNYWGFTIYDRRVSPMKPEMSEAAVYGFLIQEVLNVSMIAYNTGNGNNVEAAINRVEMSFELTTRIQGVADANNLIVVTAPVGFVFPEVCRYFSPDTQKAGMTPLPQDTECRGDDSTQLTLTLPPMRSLENSTRYEFRFRVINPLTTFTRTDIESRYWSVETRTTAGARIDSNRMVESFPIYQRLKYFKVETLSQVGLDSTTYRFHFTTDGQLPPQQTIHISPPEGTTFGGEPGRKCIFDDEDPALIAWRFEYAGLAPLISGVTRIPEWMDCEIVSATEIRLQNREPILGGRPLMTGPAFEFFVKNATNAEKTPPEGLNLFAITAHTDTPLGKEVWAADGWTIYPELRRTSVEVSNPGYGLYTDFTFELQTISEVESQGSIRIIAPDDYFFGPLDMETRLSLYDPLVAVPPAQGVMDNRPPLDQVTICHVLRSPNWVCQLEFMPCQQQAYYEELLSVGIQLTVAQQVDLAQRIPQCETLQSKCDEPGRLSDLIQCESRGSTLDLTLARDVSLPANRLFRFIVQGYNARNPPPSPEANTWAFMTRKSDNEKTVVDEKLGVPGLNLLGIVNVDAVVPSDTKVGSIENYVQVTVRLSTPCLPPAVLRIEHPLQYMRNANAAFQGASIQTGSTFPRMTEKTQRLNVIEIEAVEETLPADIPLVIQLGLSNPQISPSNPDNVWTFRAYSRQTGVDEMLNVNLNVTGFKVFGEFSLAYVAATVLSPVSRSVLAVWFKLKSELRPGPGEVCKLRIWLPAPFQPRPATGNTCDEFSLEHNPNREGVAGFTAVSTEAAAVTFAGIPSGTECSSHYDEQSGQYYTLLLLGGQDGIGGFVDYGRDYAFEFGIMNPARANPPSENTWRLETLKGDVILHLARDLPGFELEQIKEATIAATDTTANKPLNLMTFYMMTDKYIPGGSKVYITAPVGFVFTCAYFRTDSGLSNTTTCLIPNINQPHIVEFTLDSQDPKPPNSPFTLYVYVTNPFFTPQQNWWMFQIESPLRRPIDIREFIPGYDITDEVAVNIHPTFPYLGQVNPLEVSFVQETIMNQADTGNEIVLNAPEGYVFPRNCTGFRLDLTNRRDMATLNSGYQATFTFPPPGIDCTGFDNATVVVRLPNGNGLLKNNYTLFVDITNPPFQLNGTNSWSFLTRVRNEGGQKIVDANRVIEGFQLRELTPVRTDENAARSLLPSPGSLLLSLFSLAVWLMGRRP